MFNNTITISKDILNTLSEVHYIVEPLIIAKFIFALEKEPVYLLEYKLNILNIFLKSRINDFENNERITDFLNLFNIYLLKEYPFWNVDYLMRNGFVDLANEVLDNRHLAINLIIDLLVKIPEFSKDSYIRVNVFSIIINGVIF